MNHVEPPDRERYQQCLQRQEPDWDECRCRCVYLYGGGLDCDILDCEQYKSDPTLVNPSSPETLFLSKVGRRNYLSQWNQLSDQQKIEEGKSFCEWRSGMSTDLAPKLITKLGGNPFNIETLADGASIVTYGMQAFCNDLFLTYAREQAEDLRRITAPKY